jgi:hypothetical protein
MTTCRNESLSRGKKILICLSVGRAAGPPSLSDARVPLCLDSFGVMQTQPRFYMYNTHTPPLIYPFPFEFFISCTHNTSRPKIIVSKQSTFT